MDAGDIHDDFTGPVLDPRRWVAHYLPQWTVPQRSAARYDLVPDGSAPGGLRLRIDADQPAWREADGPMRVSNIQTGLFSGPPGSDRGTHRHRTDGLHVVTEQPLRRLWTPTAGHVAVRASAAADPACMLGIWLVGLEASDPADSGELCLAEVFGDRVGPAHSIVRVGVKAHHDPRLVDEILDVELPIDATGPHTYALRWSASGAEFSVDGQPVLATGQHLGYELQLMIDLFEFPGTDRRSSDDYPKTAIIHSVTGGPS